MPGLWGLIFHGTVLWRLGTESVEKAFARIPAAQPGFGISSWSSLCPSMTVDSHRWAERFKDLTETDWIEQCARNEQEITCGWGIRRSILPQKGFLYQSALGCAESLCRQEKWIGIQFRGPGLACQHQLAKRHKNISKSFTAFIHCTHWRESCDWVLGWPLKPITLGEFSYARLTGAQQTPAAKRTFDLLLSKYMRCSLIFDCFSFQHSHMTRVEGQRKSEKRLISMIEPRKSQLFARTFAAKTLDQLKRLLKLLGKRGFESWRVFI